MTSVDKLFQWLHPTEKELKRVKKGLKLFITIFFLFLRKRVPGNLGKDIEDLKKIKTRL